MEQLSICPSSRLQFYNMKIVKSIIGSRVVIGIQGTPEERERFYNKFYNFNGTSGRLHEMNGGDNGFSFFRCEEEELIEALKVSKIVERRFRDSEKKFKAPHGVTNGAKKTYGKNYLENLDKEARQEFDGWPEERFLEMHSSISPHKELDGGAPSWPPAPET